MARTNLPTTAFTPNAALADPAGAAIDQANGMTVQFPPAFPVGPTARSLVLRVKNTAAGAHTVTIPAGVNPPAFRASREPFGSAGGLATSIAAGATEWIGPFDESIFTQSDGSIFINFDAGTTGTITAFVTPGRF